MTELIDFILSLVVTILVLFFIRWLAIMNTERDIIIEKDGIIK